MPEAIPEFYNDLDKSRAYAFAMLARGVADRRSAFRTPALASVGTDGAPSVRTVVLRGLDPVAPAMRFHTDRRSEKVSELQKSPIVSLLFYDAGLKLQLRASGIAKLHADDDIAREGWAMALAMSRACYTQVQAPGEPVIDPASLPQLAGVPNGDPSGFENFAVIGVAITAIDWLYLGFRGHRRARFTWDADGKASAQWLAP